MDNSALQEKVKSVFVLYLKGKGGRCTPERLEVLKTVVDIPSHFKLDTLMELLVQKNFRVSRTTLYNTIYELEDAGIVSACRIGHDMYYEMSFERPRHHHQVCTRCGRITEFQNIELDEAIAKAKYRRFTMANYTLSVYGICTSCVTQMRREEKKRKNKNINKQ
ncbi:MAG: transcriptional repressor [Bacteroidaceae bacterium]|nr:transcriptional repressor [Bacteroidaceae bacterium]